MRGVTLLVQRLGLAVDDLELDERDITGPSARAFGGAASSTALGTRSGRSTTKWMTWKLWSENVLLLGVSVSFSSSLIRSSVTSLESRGCAWA